MSEMLCPTFDIPGLVRFLERHRYDESSEPKMQDGIALVLGTAGIPFEREAWLSDTDRVEFLAYERIAIECKISGSLGAVTRQLHRYAQSSRVTDLILVTSRSQLARVPRELNGKPVAIAATMGGLL